MFIYSRVTAILNVNLQMFNGKELKIFYLIIILSPYFAANKVSVKIFIVLVLRVNLGVILPFSLFYSYLQVILKLVTEEIFENINSIFFHFTP